MTKKEFLKIAEELKTKKVDEEFGDYIFTPIEKSGINKFKQREKDGTETDREGIIYKFRLVNKETQEKTNYGIEVIQHWAPENREDELNTINFLEVITAYIPEQRIPAKIEEVYIGLKYTPDENASE